MTFDFRDIKECYNNSREDILMIFGVNEYLLWMTTTKLPPIEQQTDKFIFINDLEVLSQSTNKTILTGSFPVPRQEVNTSDEESQEGTSWYGPDWNKATPSQKLNYDNTIGGYKTSKRTKYPAFWQFVKFAYTEGIYLYVPEFKSIVSKNSPELIWEYTRNVQDGFDFTPYLSDDPFNDNSGWIDVTLKYTYQSANYYESDFVYKEFNFVEWPTVIIWAGGYTPTIYDFFGYDDGTHVVRHSRCMVKPKSQSDYNNYWLQPKRSTSYHYWIGAETISNSGTSGKYIAILPFNTGNMGW